MKASNNYVVYAHVFPNGKLYIGISMNIKCRWSNRGHKYHNQILMSRAIEKYGWDNIQHIVLIDGLSKDVACECERYLISKYQSNNPRFGYNKSTGGEYNSGFAFTHTEEAKKKISEAGKGKVISESQRQSVSRVHKGKKLSDETRQKIRESVLNMDEASKKEWKRKISESVKQRWRDGTYKNANMGGQTPWNKGLTKLDDPRLMSVSNKMSRRKHTDEAKRKISEAGKGRPAVNRRKVVCVETGIVYDSVLEATKFAKTGIGKALRDGIRAGGYHWRYYE